MILDTTILDQVTQQFLATLKHDGDLIRQVAVHIFYYLVVIQLSLTMIWLMIEGVSLQQLFARFVQLSFTFGFFYTLILNAGSWLPKLLNGFIQIGQTSGIQSLDPSSIIDQGASIAGAIFKGLFSWGLLSNPFVGGVGTIVCLVIIILYALMAAELAILLVKSYVVIALGSFFFALGATDTTRNMSKSYFQAAIGLGLKLMSLYLLLGVGVQIGNNWASIAATASQNHDIMPMLIIVAAVVVYYMILKNVPSFIAGLSGIGGFHNMGDQAVAATINAATTAASLMTSTTAKAIQGLAQTGSAISHGINAYKTGSSHGESPLGNLYHGTKTVTGALASAGANTVKNMAMRQNGHLSKGQKFNSHMANKIKSLQSKSSS